MKEFRRELELLDLFHDNPLFCQVRDIRQCLATHSFADSFVES